MVETKTNTKSYLNICVIRKEKNVAKEAFGGQEEFSEFDSGQQQKEMKKKGCQDQENQKVLLQVCWVCTLSGDEN